MKNSQFNVGITIVYRGYQTVFKWGARILPFPFPKVVKGENSILQIPMILKAKGKKRAFIVTDETLIKLGLLNPLLEEFKKQKMIYELYDKIQPDPTVELVEQGYQYYQQTQSDCLVAFGGGSSIDCAKAIGIRVVKPHRSLIKMAGLLKVRKKIPYLIAVPTTAGTGSETTIATVIKDGKTNKKYPISDFSLMPDIAVLDPLVTLKLPQKITATTGMDALTHAVEAYIGRSNTKFTKTCAKEAVLEIDKALLRASFHGEDVEARELMLSASYKAGQAFTQAYVGYVHALAHALGGKYKIPHGLANAVLLPQVLEVYGSSAEKPLAELAKILNLHQENDEKSAKAFIQYIKSLNQALNIPTKFKEILEEDIEEIAKWAAKEANPTYPVPKLLKEKTLETILRLVKE